MKMNGKRYRQGMSTHAQKLGLFSSVYVAGIRSPMWKHLQKVFTWKILRH